MKRPIKQIPWFLALLLTAATALAQADPALETFRADLVRYVSSLRQLPSPLLAQFQADPKGLERAQQAIGAMSMEELRALKVQMDRVPFWPELPAYLNRALAEYGRDGAPSPRAVAMALPGAFGGPVNPESLRAPMLKMIAEMRKIPAETVNPRYQTILSEAEQMIQAATANQLVELQAAMREQMPVWSAALEGQPQAMIQPNGQRLAPMGHCGDDFPGGIICRIGEAITAIGDFFTVTLPNAFNSAINSIKNIFLEAVGKIPDTFAEIADTLGLDDVNWAAIANTALTYARLPCPPTGFNLPGFGVVGEIRTWTNFSGSIGFAGNTIQELTPSDILTSANLQAVTIILNFPIQWLSRCLEEAWQDKFEVDQETHRDLVETNLDAKASTLATKTNVFNAGTELLNLDGHVNSANTNLANKINAAFDTIKNAQNSNMILIGMFQGRLIRQIIEAQLLSSGRISLFQLPQGVGGHLERVRDIVDETLTKRQQAGLNINSARQAFNNGVKEHGLGRYKNAYKEFRNAYRRAVGANDEDDDD